MKTQIETTVKIKKNLPLINPIIGICTAAKTPEELQQSMFELRTRRPDIEKAFIWGYGSNHFWLSEDNTERERLLFVDFYNR